MRKNLWMLFMLLFSMNVVMFTFTSCSDDDDPIEIDDDDDDDDDDDEDDDDEDDDDGKDDKLSWEDFVAEYTGSALNLNNRSAADFQSAEITAGSTEGKVHIAMTNVYPEVIEMVFTDVELIEGENGVFGFEAEQAINTTSSTLYLSGTVSMNEDNVPVIAANVAREIDSPLVGKWDISPSGLIGLNVIADLDGDGQITDYDKLLAQMVFGGMTGMLNSVIADKVSSVHIDFSQNGTLDVAWTTPEGVTTDLYQTISAAANGMIPVELLRQMLVINYFVIDEGMVFIALDKTVMNILDMVGPLISGDFDLEAILNGVLGLLQDRGGYYALGLGYETDGNDLMVYADKNLLARALPVVSGLIDPKLTPEGFEETLVEYLDTTIRGMIEAPTTETFDLQAHFVSVD